MPTATVYYMEAIFKLHAIHWGVRKSVRRDVLILKDLCGQYGQILLNKELGRKSEFLLECLYIHMLPLLGVAVRGLAGLG